jgi:general stress protein 26
MDEPPLAELDARFSAPGAQPTPWDDTADVLATAQLYWLTTVRSGGRPHTTPLLAVWDDGDLHITTGEDEQKARNLVANQAVTISTGNGLFAHGLDVVVEGTAERVVDEDRLATLAGHWVDKYGKDWEFGVADGAFTHAEGGSALVFAVRPRKILTFAKSPHGQTRYRF